MRRLPSKIISLLCALGAPIACADDDASSDDKPDALVVQFAGNIGVLAAGIERQFFDSSWHASVLLGYAPASITGVDVYTAAAKFSYHMPWSISGKDNKLTPYAGLMLSYYFGDEYDSSRYAPTDYYPYPGNQWHVTPYLGVRLTAPSSSMPDLALYAELGIHDAYFGYWYYNDGYRGLEDIVNLAVGLSIPLD